MAALDTNWACGYLQCGGVWKLSSGFTDAPINTGSQTVKSLKSEVVLTLRLPLHLKILSVLTSDWRKSSKEPPLYYSTCKGESLSTLARAAVPPEYSHRRPQNNCRNDQARPVLPDMTEPGLIIAAVTA